MFCLGCQGSDEVGNYFTSTFLKSLSHASMALARPSRVNTTDFALFRGLVIGSFSYNPFNTSQSRPFQALYSSCSVRASKAKKKADLL